MKTTRVKIEGLHCLSCIEKVEQALDEIRGVVETDVKLNDITTITHAEVPEKELLDAVAKAGYRAHIVREDPVYQG